MERIKRLLNVWGYIRSALIVWAIGELQKDIYKTAKNAGWWDRDRNEAEVISLIHAEVTEILEAYRDGNPPSKKINRSLADEEKADTVIRILDFAEYRQINLGEVILEKNKYNKTRTKRHGGKKY